MLPAKLEDSSSKAVHLSQPASNLHRFVHSVQNHDWTDSMIRLRTTKARAASLEQPERPAHRFSKGPQ